VPEERYAVIRIVIELNESSDPIEGSLIEPSTHAAPFRGWLALSTMIESVRTAGDPAGANVHQPRGQVPATRRFSL
jgi:hypothetical protein